MTLSKTYSRAFFPFLRASPPATSGLTAVVLGSLLSSAMGALLYAAHAIDPAFSCLTTSFIRVLCSSVLAVFLFRGNNFGTILGDKSPSLWIWGIAGAITVSTYFCAIQRIGMGGATFLLQASFAVLITLAGPFLLKQRNSPLTWLALGGAAVGLFLMQGGELGSGDGTGKLLALVSGASSAVAYLMIARSGTAHSPAVVMFYWCLATLVFHLGAFCFYEITWPRTPAVWLLIIAAGFIAGLAQNYYTIAYQRGPAAAVTSVSYLTPVLSLGLDAWLFRISASPEAYAGSALILFFGVLLPFTEGKQHAPGEAACARE